MPESTIKSGYHPTRMFFWQRIVWDDLEEEVEAITGAQASIPIPSAPATKLTQAQGQPRAYVASQPGMNEYVNAKIIIKITIKY